MTEKLNIKIGTMISIVVLAASVVGTYYQGQAQSKDYTDEKAAKIEDKVDANMDKIKEDINKTKTDVEVIKQILLQKYGKPKDQNGYGQGHS